MFSVSSSSNCDMYLYINVMLLVYLYLPIMFAYYVMQGQNISFNIIWVFILRILYLCLHTID